MTNTVAVHWTEKYKFSTILFCFLGALATLIWYKFLYVEVSQEVRTITQPFQLRLLAERGIQPIPASTDLRGITVSHRQFSLEYMSQATTPLYVQKVTWSENKLCKRMDLRARFWFVGNDGILRFTNESAGTAPEFQDKVWFGGCGVRAEGFFYDVGADSLSYYFSNFIRLAFTFIAAVIAWFLICSHFEPPYRYRKL